MSVNFNGRAFAVFDAALFGTLFAERRDSQLPDLIVDLAEGGFGKFMRWLHPFLERRYAGESAIGLFARQCLQNLANVFDLRNAMAYHYQVVSSIDRETNCFFQSVAIQNRAHVEI